jgi:hypothetical protein
VTADERSKRPFIALGNVALEQLSIANGFQLRPNDLFAKKLNNPGNGHVHLIRAGLSFQGYYFPEDVVLLRDFPRIVGAEVFCSEKGPKKELRPLFFLVADGERSLRQQESRVSLASSLCTRTANGFCAPADD